MVDKLSGLGAQLKTVPSKLNNSTLSVIAAVLVLLALTVALWPVKSELEFNCGSFLVPNGGLLEESQAAGLDIFATEFFKNGLNPDNPLLMNAIRSMGLEALEECEGERSRQGVIAGVVLVLGLGTAGFVGNRVYRSKDQAPTVPGSGTTA